MLAQTGSTTAGRPSVAADILDRFHANGNQGPARPISLDWSVGPAFHAWNREATSIIAQYCLEDLQKDSTVVSQLSKINMELSHDFVLRHVRTKLSTVGRVYRRATEQGPVAMSQRDNVIKKRHRQTTRRRTVGLRS